MPAPLFKPGRTLPTKDLKAWAIEAHQLVRQSNCPNYEQARVRVPTELNINNWRQLCGNYHDQLLLDYLEFGFPLCVDRSQLVFNNIDNNHPSAEDHTSDVEAYLSKEIKHQAVVGPFNNFPFDVHYSPMLTRPKPDDTRRVIVNLSYPYHASVNDNISATTYDGTEFELKYPTVDDIVGAIKALNSNALLSKIDISRAFRNLRVDPHDFDLLGLKWGQKSYLDLSVPMGLKTGSAMCQRTTDVIRHVMRSKNIDVYNYLDDLICVHKIGNASAEFETLYTLFEFLGLPINPKKVVPPTRALTCMGILIDIDAGTMLIPRDKCTQILDACKWCLSKTFITKKQLQSLLGKRQTCTRVR